MAPKRAKIFNHRGGQAVRLPLELRFDSDEVYISRDPISGDVILSERRNTWEEFFALRDEADVPRDFLADRGDAPPADHQPFRN